jgi:pimeloyl-ACP methyl ester carboxylesterase
MVAAGRRRFRVLALMAIASVLGAGCSDAAEPSRPSTTSPSPTSSPSPSAEPTPGRPLSFRASDGIRIEGRLFGEGRVGVVLGHQIDGDQTDWWDFAEQLAGEGYAALSINFRGYCPGDEAGCSDDAGTEEAWRDLVAGATWLRRHGVQRVALIGASMGGTAAVLAASRAGSDVDGVITLSAPSDCCGMVVTRGDVEAVKGPMLFVAGRFDGDLPASARRLARWAGSSGEIVILASGEHGRDLLGGLATPQVQRRTTELILDFLAGVAAA